MFLFAGITQAAEFNYVGVKKCRSCHKKKDIGNQYKVWQEGKHSKAYEVLATEDAKKVGAKVGVDDPQTSDQCLKCHVTGYGLPAERFGKKFDKAEGVGCESCHGPGSGYRKKKVMIDHDLSVAKGLVEIDEKVCLQCHNDESPTFDPAKPFDYAERSKESAHPVPEGYDPKADKDEGEE
jgi:hypothetical protein